MKVWLKYLIGIALGVVSYLILHLNTVQSQETLNFIVEMIIRIGRYSLVPMLFFSIATACCKLREERLIFKTGMWTLVIILGSTLLLTIIGLISGLLIKLPRIPITNARTTDTPVIEYKPLLRALFPYNGFTTLLEGSYLLPVFVFAGLIGSACANDKHSVIKSTTSWFDSMSLIMYKVSVFFTELLSVGLIALTAKWTLDFITLRKASNFMPLFTLLAVDLLLVAGLIYPFMLWIICRERHPFKVLYASIAPVLVAFISGDTNLTLPVSTRHSRESLGIKRKINAAALPLFSIFARGGAALVQCIAFILILRSYAPTAIEMKTIIWIGTMSFIFSFGLSAFPSGGAFIAIAVMCKIFGPAYEAGYLLIKDIAPIICAFAAAFDAVTAMFGTYMIGMKTKTIKPVDVRHYI